jgi:hypothetical protein
MTVPHVALVGAPSPLRAAVAQQLHTAAARLTCMDTPAQLTSVAGREKNLDGATVDGCRPIHAGPRDPPGAFDRGVRPARRLTFCGVAWSYS